MRMRCPRLTMAMRSAANKCVKILLRSFVLLALSWTNGGSQAQPASDHKERDKTAAASTRENDKNTETTDPLGRSTPHGTVFGFLQAAQSGKYQEDTTYIHIS